MKIGVLALQGDFREHIAASEKAGHSALGIRRPSELEEIDATDISEHAPRFDALHKKLQDSLNSIDGL